MIRLIHYVSFPGCFPRVPLRLQGAHAGWRDEVCSASKTYPGKGPWKKETQSTVRLCSRIQAFSLVTWWSLQCRGARGSLRPVHPWTRHSCIITCVGGSRARLLGFRIDVFWLECCLQASSGLLQASESSGRTRQLYQRGDFRIALTAK